jgi:DNA-binding protein HU-beta
MIELKRLTIDNMTKKTVKPAKTSSKIVSKKTLTERVNAKQKKLGLTKNQVESTINNLLEEVKSSLINGEEVRLLGYFSFKTAVQKERMAINLQTKKKMKVPAKRVPKIKFSDALKKEVAKK